MGVARETIVAALMEILKFEEFTVENLAEVSRFDFHLFAPHEEKKIRRLLSKLKEDTGEHQRMILKIMERLGYDPQKTS